MRYLLGAMLFTTALFSAESRFSEAEAKFNREYDAAKAVFDKAVKVARDKLIVAYNKEMKRLTTTGDLDGAVALRDKIESLSPKVEQPQLAWDDIKAPIFVVQADKPFEVGVLGPGKWKIIPNMDDKWTTSVAHPDQNVSCDGVPSRDNKSFTLQHKNLMLLIYKFKTSVEVIDSYQTIITGPGKLTLLANDSGYGDNGGSIRVKIIKVQ